MHRTPLQAWLSRSRSARAVLAILCHASLTAGQLAYVLRGRFARSTVRHAVEVLAIAGAVVSCGKRSAWPGKRAAMVWAAQQGT
jgi:hypothetical protein